jgi:hypothetical protein
MNPKAKPRKRLTPEQWQAIIKDFEHSGQTVEQFCKQRDLGYVSFCKWRHRFSKKEDVATKNMSTPDFIDLGVLDAPQSSQPGWNIVLALGNGVELRLSRN